MKRLILLVLGGLSLSACAYPQSTIEQGLAPGVFRIQEAPLGTVVLIDGRMVGQRTKATSDDFSVSPGLHTVEERFGDQMLLRKPYSLDAGAIIIVANLK